LEFGDFGFCEGGKTGELREKALEQGENQYMALNLNRAPGSHWWEAKAFTRVPTLLPRYSDSDKPPKTKDA